MSTETIAPPAALATPDEALSPRTLLLAVLAMSFSSLVLELSLTRLFSVILFYHFAFLAISVALLGLGAGGVFAYLRKPWLSRWSIAQLGVFIGLANALVILAVVEFDLHIKADLGLTWRNFGRISAIYITSALPFFLTGLFLSIVYARRTRGIAQLYAADLGGGALACLAVVPLLNFVGGPSTIIAAAAAMAVAAAILAGRRGTRTFSAVVAGLLAVVAIVNYSGRLVDIVYAKGMRRDKSWVEFARWNAISRVEVDNQGGARVIVIDADASTYIMNTDPHDWRPDYRQNLMSAAPSVANVLRPHGSYAIIGPGGGVDVLRAVANGSPSVTGIEINPIIVNDIMRGRYADWSHHLYELPEVHMNVADGRSWVRNSRDQYDVIQMTLVDTWASTAAGAFALSENNLYTVEAFREYFDHLKPDGIIAITRWEFTRPREALRVVAQEIEALKKFGVTDFSKHFIVISDGPLDEDGRPVLVLAKKSEFTPAEESAALTHVATNPNLYPVYTPVAFAGRQDTAQPADLDPGIAELRRTRRVPSASAEPFRQLIRGDDPTGTPLAAVPAVLQQNVRSDFVAGYPYNISPVYDDAPFFFFTIKPESILKGVLGGTGHGMDWRINLGVVVLGIVLLMSIACVLLFLIVPLAFHAPARSHSTLGLMYFVAIGLGYILAEISFIQRFVLFLGHPVYALTVVVFLMLLASGAGSLLSRRLLPDTTKVWAPLAIIVALLLIYAWGLPPVLHATIGMPFAVKLLISAAVLVPLGFAMGMPFPTGLRMLGESSAGNTTVEWAWAMNAAASVLGSVLAIVIAIRFGLAITLACGAVAYFLALAVRGRLRRASL